MSDHFWTNDGNLILQPEDQVDMLKKQYESVFSSPIEAKKVMDHTTFFKSNEAEEQLDNAVFDRNDIVDALDKLSSNSAPGPDGIPSILLKKHKFSLADALLIILHKIFSS